MSIPPSPAPGWPTTLPEAVERVAEHLSAEERMKLAALEEHVLTQLNSGLGARIRKLCGLWQGNFKLMASCGARNPEDASLAILQTLWDRLRQS